MKKDYFTALCNQEGCRKPISQVGLVKSVIGPYRANIKFTCDSGHSWYISSECINEGTPFADWLDRGTMEPPKTKPKSPVIEFTPWVAPDPEVVESVERTVRDQWSEELADAIAEDPTVTFVGSGDRIMIAMIDDDNDERTHITIEDCIITRRRYAVITKKGK